MSIKVSGGGGSGGYPGVIGDGATPAGIHVAGNVIMDENIRADLHTLDSGHSFQTYTGGGIQLLKETDSFEALDLVLSAGSSGAEVTLANPDIAGYVWRINADGSESLHKGLGEYGKTAPASAASITGTLTGATLAQLTSIVSQILVALDAKGTVTNSTT